MIRIDKRKLAGIVLAGVLTFAGATTAFAADVNTEARLPVQKQFITIDKEEITSKIKTALDSLVKAGTITQAQADAALKNLTPGEGRIVIKDVIKNNPLKETLDELVKAGTITQAQEDAILKALPEKLEAGMHRGGILKRDPGEQGVFTKPGMRFGHNPLSGLVSDGTLTQEQAESILEAVRASLRPESKQ